MGDIANIDQAGYAIFVSEVQELLSCITASVRQPADQIDLNELMRFAHTLKGVLAIYGLDAAVAATHAMEDNLQVLQRRRQPMTKLDRLRLQRSAQVLGKQIVQGMRKLSAGLAKPLNSGGSKANVPTLVSAPLSTGSLVVPTLYDKVNVPTLTTVAPILKKYLDTADHLARKLGKKVDIHISGTEVPLPQPGMTLLFASVLHVIRNAVDHGIETSAKRLAMGKPERGSLRLIARQYRGMFVLCIADDGAGIDTRRVRDVAIRKGLIARSLASRATQGDLLDLIFLPGLSLKQRVSAISGRGVGMDAVKFAVERLQGRIEVKTALGKGTVIKISVPYLQSF